MTLELLEARIAAAISGAQSHADKCRALVMGTGLTSAIEYCQKAGMEPPKCSLTAQTDNAKKLRDATERKLSDPAWWKNSLESFAIQSYENEQRSMGNVTNFIPDGLAAYMTKRKR